MTFIFIHIWSRPTAKADEVVWMWILCYTDKAKLVQEFTSKDCSKEMFDSFTWNLQSLYLLRCNMFWQRQPGSQTTPTITALMLSQQAMATKSPVFCAEGVRLSDQAGSAWTQKQICTTKIHRWHSYFSRNTLISWEYLAANDTWNNVMPQGRIGYVYVFVFFFKWSLSVMHKWMVPLAVIMTSFHLKIWFYRQPHHFSSTGLVVLSYSRSQMLMVLLCTVG